MSNYLRAFVPLFEEADRLLGEYRPGKYERLVRRVEKQERAAERADRQTVAKDAAAARFKQQTQQRETKPDPRPLCGAATRAGGSCKAKCVPGRKRCRLHGGLSTGPKSQAGRAAIAESNRRRGLARLVDSTAPRTK